MTTLELKPAYMVEIESKLATYAVAFAKGGSSHAERDDLLAAISALSPKPAPDMTENLWLAIHAYCKALRNNEEAGQTDHEATMMRSHIALATAKENLGSAISAIAAKPGELAQRDARIAELEARINTPETEDFMKAVPLEAAHQIERWGEDHDKQKGPWDWFWTLGYLGGKAAQAMLRGDTVKVKHHTITVAALALSWHRHVARSVLPNISAEPEVKS